MRCEELEAIVFSGREATEEERAAMREHAGTCEACRVLLEQEQLLRGARELDACVQMPESFTQGWRARVRAQAHQQMHREKRGSRASAMLRGLRRSWVPRAAAWACCAAVLLGVGAQLGARRQNAQDTAASQAVFDGARVSSVEEDTGAAGGLARTRSMSAADAGTQEARKIVRTAEISLNTDALDAAVQALRERTAERGGSVTSCEIAGTQEEGRSAYLELSVPSGELEPLLEDAQALGEVIRQSSRDVDRTGSYQDTAARLESARAQKQRLDELYAQAENMEDILAITDALFDVQAEIDSLEGASREMDARSDNAQVSVFISEESSSVRQGPFFTRLAGALLEGAQALGSGLEELALAAAFALPGLFAATVLAFLVLGGIRHVRRRKKRRPF
ncbi:MAG TPA: DUF4349 domain-containing protein [Candidatus Ventricola intestinavium]|nr:DUF4349 domain-containing protein [Candidatus Ventricola intestinavium]